MSSQCSCKKELNTGIIKRAFLDLVDAKPYPTDSGQLENMIKEASSKIETDGSAKINKILKEEMAKHPTALFFKAKAIEANIPNNNGDHFSETELKKAVGTFVGVPFFTNHQNSDVEKAKGKIVYAEWNENDKSIYVIAFVDREAYPHLCRGIEEGYVNGVSMGFLHGDSVITMADLSSKKIKDVQAGDKILSPFGNVCEVEKTYCDILGKPMYQLETTTYHDSPLFSDDHPVYVIDGETIKEQKEKSIKSAHSNMYLRRKYKINEIVGQDAWRKYEYSPEFRETKDIKIGDYVLIPSKYKLINKDSNDSDFYYMCGAYLGDGYLTNNKNGEKCCLSYSLGLHEKEELAEKLIKIINKELPEKNVCRTEFPQKNGLKISVYNKTISEIIFKKFGKLSHEKRIYQSEFTKNQICSLISGYIDTDGTIAKTYNKTQSGKIRGNGIRGVLISSCNRELLQDVQSLLILIDVSSYITWNNRTPNEKSLVKIPTLDFSLFIPYSNLHLFRDSIKVSKCLTQERAKIKAGRTFIFTDKSCQKYMACPVKNIHEIEFSEPGYDLKVKDDESYIANGVAVHNCSVDYSVCSICGKKATSQEDYCSHIKNLKGRKFTGRVTDAKTGEIKEVKNAAVYEDNFGIRFIELSGVVDPACASCKIKDVYQNNKLAKAATKCMDDLSVFQNSEYFQKSASQQDVDKLNQALNILQEIAIKLIQNRANIEMEFSADIVQILADLQEYVEGLVQAGFGKIQDTPQNIPGNAPAGEAPPALGAEAQPGTTQPVSQELGGVGQVSGTEGVPLTTPPVAPEAVSSLDQTLRPSPQQPSKSMGIIRPTRPAVGRKSSEDGDNSEMRRIPTKISEQKNKVSNVLETNWQEKLENFSNSLKESLKVELASNDKKVKTGSIGGTIMSTKINQEAAKSKEAPLATVEKRLDEERGGLHPRTDKVVEDVEGKQLTTKHKGEENVTEQVLLEKARTDDTPGVVEEKVLEPSRQGDTAAETEQVKLEKQRVNKEPNTTMENLLGESKNDSPSTRSASTMADYVKSAVKTISKTVVCAQSTPDRVIKIAGSLSTLPLSEQTSLIKKIASYNGETTSYDDFKKRASFWIDKGLQVTSASDKEIKDMLITFAGKAVNKKGLNPELIVRAFAVLKNNPNSSMIIEKKVKEILAKGMNIGQKSAEDEMNEHIVKEAKGFFCDKCKKPFKGDDHCKCGKEESKEETKEEETKKCSMANVKAETEILSKALEKEAKEASNLIIETSFDEMGIPKELRENDQVLASYAEAFVRGACAHLGVKVAAVVNVTVDQGGDVVIAVDTAEGGSVEIPTFGEEEEPELPEMPETPEAGAAETSTETPLETTPPPPAEGAQDFGATTPPPAPAAGAPAGGGISTMTSSKKVVKTAQMGGGSPGPGAAADPNAPTGKSVDPTAEVGGPPPGEAEGLQTFTDEDEELPGDEEQKEPGSICFLCGSTDTETGRKDQAPGQFDCNNCGAKYSIHVNVEVLNPEELLGEKTDMETELEKPEGPSMPVAAEMSLDREVLKKVAKTQKDVGHICPACGGLEVEVSGQPADLSIKCKKCKTESNKAVLINIDNPLESVMRVSWNLDPMKRKCKSCRENAKNIAVSRVFGRMLKNASSVKDFPEAKVRGWLKATYPNIEVVNNGPHKGENFADTVVSQLKKFGLLKNKYLVALAEVQAKEDPMDTCIRDNKKKGYTLAESEKLCNCLKQKYASEEDGNIFIQAFGNKETFKKTIDLGILRKMAEHDSKKLAKEGTASNIQIDEEATLDTLPEVPVEKKLTEEDLIKGIQEDISLFPEKSEAKVSAKTEEKKVTVAADFKNPPPDVAKKGDETKTKYVDVKEKNVKGDGVVKKDNHMIDNEMKAKPSRSAIGDELKEGIPGPDVPRSDATMGKETKAPEAGVKVPSKETGIDTSALGQSEASNEGDKMKKQAYGEIEPSKRVKDPVLKNPDNTSGDTALEQKKDTEKKVQVVDTAKGDAQVARGEAHIGDENRIGNEGPKVPRGDAKMGNENPPDAKEPTIPSEVADTQVQMTGRNTTEAERQNQLEKIAAVRREHAMKYAGQLLEKGLIKEEEVEEFVGDLSAMPLDRMKVHVAMMLKAVTAQTKTAQTSQPASPTLTTPIVKEAQTITAPVAENEPTLAEKLAKCFTIGGKEYDRQIRLDMAEKEKEDNLFSTR